MTRLSLKTETTTNDLVVNNGTADNANNGDKLRNAFGKLIKSIDRAEANFIELYATTGADAPANELVNGLHVVSLGTDGALTFPDDLKIANSVISRRLEQLGEGTVDAVGSKLTLTDNSIAMEAYTDPDGLNNTQYSRVTAGGSVVLKAATETVGGESSTIVTVGGGFSVVSTDGVTTGTFGVDMSGFVLLSNDHYIEPLSTDLRIASNGSAIISSNSAEVTRTRSWTFNTSGTITTPLMLPLTFNPILDSEHMTRGVGLTDTPWQFTVEFQVNPNGTVQTAIDNPTWTSNPGYIDGDEFVYVEADHGIPGYTFSLVLTDIVEGEGWSANIAVQPPPVYPSTVASLGAIKLTSNDQDFVFGTNGTLTLPAGGDIVNSLGVSVLGGASYDQPLNTTDNVSFSTVSATSYVGAPEYRIGNSIRSYGSAPVTVLGGATDAVYSFDDWFTSAKLVIQVEGQIDGDLTGIDHTQTCEATIALSYNTASDPVMSVYGIVHTSLTPLATFTIRRGTGIFANKIELVAENSQTTNDVRVKVQAIQFVSRYD